jgi:hypothetical protein
MRMRKYRGSSTSNSGALNKHSCFAGLIGLIYPLNCYKFCSFKLKASISSVNSKSIGSSIAADYSAAEVLPFKLFPARDLLTYSLANDGTGNSF